jgi:hypothetical protein
MPPMPSQVLEYPPTLESVTLIASNRCFHEKVVRDISLEFDPPDCRRARNGGEVRYELKGLSGTHWPGP